MDSSNLRPSELRFLLPGAILQHRPQSQRNCAKYTGGFDACLFEAGQGNTFDQVSTVQFAFNHWLDDTPGFSNLSANNDHLRRKSMSQAAQRPANIRSRSGNLPNRVRIAGKSQRYEIA